MVGNRVGGHLDKRMISSLLPTLFSVKGAVANVCKVIRLVSIHGFVLDGQFCRTGWATADTPSESAGSGVRIKIVNLCATIAYDSLSLDTD